MIDSPWGKLSGITKDQKNSYLSVCLDIYCPSQSLLVREENSVHGFYTVEQMIA